MLFRRPEKHCSFREFIARLMEVEGEPAAERWIRSAGIDVNHAAVQDARKELQTARQENRSVLGTKARITRHWRPEDVDDLPKGWKFVGSGGGLGFHFDGRNVGATSLENFLAKAFELHGENVMHEWCRNHDVRPTDPEYIKAFKFLKQEEEPKYNLKLDRTKTKNMTSKSSDFSQCRQGEQSKMGGPRGAEKESSVSGAASKGSPSGHSKPSPPKAPGGASASKPSLKPSLTAGVPKPSPKAPPMAGM